MASNKYGLPGHIFAKKLRGRLPFHIPYFHTFQRLPTQNFEYIVQEMNKKYSARNDDMQLIVSRIHKIKLAE